MAVALVICTRADHDSRAAESALAQIRSIPAIESSSSRRRSAPAGSRRCCARSATAQSTAAIARACHQATGAIPSCSASWCARCRPGRPVHRGRRRRGHGKRPRRPSRTRCEPPSSASAAPGPRARPATAVLGDDVDSRPGCRARGSLPLSEATPAAGNLMRAGILDDAACFRFRHPILAAATRRTSPRPSVPPLTCARPRLLRARGADPERMALSSCTPRRPATRAWSASCGWPPRARARGAPATAVAAAPPCRRRATRRRRHAPSCCSRSARPNTPSEKAAKPLLTSSRRAPRPTPSRGDAHSTNSSWPARAACRAGAPLRPLVEQTLLEPCPSASASSHCDCGAIQIVLRTGSPGDADAALDEGHGLTGATPGEAVLLGHLSFVRMRSDGSATEIAAIAEQASRQADAPARGARHSARRSPASCSALLAQTGCDAAKRVLDHAEHVAPPRGATADFAIALTFRASVHRRAGPLLQSGGRRAQRTSPPQSSPHRPGQVAPTSSRWSPR